MRLMRRVTPVDFIQEQEYDKEKYHEMLLCASPDSRDGAWNFRFDRTLYGDTRRKNKKCWYRLREDRMRDIDTERNVHDG